MRTHQFREDNGPLSHPVRPESFVEINNFYTVTVYEKGAEVIGMLKRLVGDDAYSKALDLYFERHDGEAATVEDWLKVFEDTTGRDLSRFKGWYHQAGTPRLGVKETYDNGTLTLDFTQVTPPTAGQPKKTAQVIPIAVGLLNDNGDEVLPTTVLEMTAAEQSFTFEGLASRPVVSVLRDFSAPVYLEHPTSDEKRFFLMAHDTDLFNRWDAANTLMRECLIRMSAQDSTPDPLLLKAMSSVLTDETLDPAFRALMMVPPIENEIAAQIADRGQLTVPEKIYDAHQRFSKAVANYLEDALRDVYTRHQITAEYMPNAEQSSSRSLANIALNYISRLDDGKTAAQQYALADNMTQQLTALTNLLRVGSGQSELTEFYDQWASERLVIDKWFGVQIATAKPDDLINITSTLVKHPDFTIRNPNRFRSVFGNFTRNFSGFHCKSGVGYALLTDWLIKVDKINPQLTARMCNAFQEGPFDNVRKSLITSNLNRLLQTEGLSVDTTEIAMRITQG
jgi:aminopeptidase N